MEKVSSGFRVLEGDELLQVAGGPYEPPGVGGGGGGDGDVTITPTANGVSVTGSTPLSPGTTLSGTATFTLPGNVDLGIHLTTDDGQSIEFHENWDGTVTGVYTYDDGHGHVIHVSVWHNVNNGAEGLGVSITF